MTTEGIQKLVTLFNTTKENFAKQTLCYIDPDHKPHFCGMGLILHDLGYECENLSGMFTIDDYEYVKVPDKPSLYVYDKIKLELWEKYKLSFDAPYTSKIYCPLCKIKSITQYMSSLENVINHINDTHAFSFMEVARWLLEFAKFYNLETGMRI